MPDETNPATPAAAAPAAAAPAATPAAPVAAAPAPATDQVKEGEKVQSPAPALNQDQAAAKAFQEKYPDPQERILAHAEATQPKRG